MRLGVTEMNTHEKPFQGGGGDVQAKTCIGGRRVPLRMYQSQ